MNLDSLPTLRYQQEQSTGGSFYTIPMIVSEVNVCRMYACLKVVVWGERDGLYFLTHTH